MTKREDGRWVETMVFTVNGRKQRKYFYGATKREVLDKIADFEAERKQGRKWQEVIDEWWAEYEPTLSYNSLRGRLPAYQRAREAFPQLRCGDLTTTTLVKWLSKVIKSQNMAASTAATQLSILRLACKHAVVQGDLEVNIAREIDLPSGLKKERRELPSERDINIIKQYDGTGSQGAMYAFWAMYTGLRKGELLGLRWEDVDFENREINVRRSVYHVSNTPHTKEPKTKAGIRIVPIVDKLASTMHPQKSGIIFPNNVGEYMSSTQYHRMWELFIAETGVTCTSHQLRHMLATLLLENNIPTEQARIILGHTDAATTERIYQHIRDDLRRRETRKILSLEL